MLRITMLSLAVVLTSLALADTAEAQQPRRQTLQGQRAAWISQYYPWHGSYGYPHFPGFGRPLALVVPPNAGLQTHYGWGVANSRVGMINHQFSPTFPGYGAGGSPGQFRMPPPQPSDTTQFGVYYVRGPW
ncbi:MAG: hypothetical protein MI757_22910 [Pirellulales bacterium]|nr:hypothetical protein [Pirellulales bacterium]